MKKIVLAAVFLAVVSMSFGAVMPPSKSKVKKMRASSSKSSKPTFYTNTKPVYASRSAGNKGWKTSAKPKYRQPTGQWYEDKEDVKGEPWIEICLSSQIARFYKGDELVGRAPISSGMEGYETKDGVYRVLEKEKDHVSSLYGSFVNSAGKIVGYGKAGDTPPRGTHYEPSPMPYFLRLDDSGLGLHAGFLPGYPASHGCIRLPHDIAEKFFRHAKVGTRVEVD